MEKATRPIIIIDEEKCDGCGACIPACAEGALQIIEGKAKLVSEVYCDGLGACLGVCPRGAISIEERPAAAFDEEAVKARIQNEKNSPEFEMSGCPSALMSLVDKPVVSQIGEQEASDTHALVNWPVQLALVPPVAPFLNDANVLLVADCIPFVYANFHAELVKGKPILVTCPKLDDVATIRNKLTAIISQSGIKSLSIAKMEVPCCNALVQITKQAMQDAGKEMPIEVKTIKISGK